MKIRQVDIGGQWCEDKTSGHRGVSGVKIRQVDIGVNGVKIRQVDIGGWTMV